MAQVLKSQEENRVPDLIGLSLREVLNRVRGMDVKVKIRGSGLVTEMKPSPGEELPSNRSIDVLLQ
jgi:hypothetical protein